MATDPTSEIERASPTHDGAGVASAAPCSAFASLAKTTYDAATALWFASGVERHAEGHPGVPGPSGDAEPWDIDRAHIQGAIIALNEIHRRLYLPNA